MFPIRFMKAHPTLYVLHYKHGKLKQQGPGLSFFYWAPTSSLVGVPLASMDAPFVFHESTADFQAVTVQGQLTFRIADAPRIASLLDYSLDPRGKYATDDPQKLPERLINATQTLTRAVTSSLGLRQALGSADRISTEVLAALRDSETATTLGVDILGLSILTVRPTPEMAKALEAEAREELQRGADEAVYARRNAAVEQERRIRESELSTEIAVEEKKRQIRETQMAADIAVEQQRAALIDQKVENDRKDADSRAYALSITLKPIQELDWRKLMMLSSSGGDPRNTIAMAFQEMAANAQKIGELNMSPELLHALVKGK